MTAYHNYYCDFPGRCIDILKHFEPEAKERGKEEGQGGEVTLLLMAASSAFLIPYERMQSNHPSSDSEQRSLSFNEALNTKWRRSLLSRDTEDTEKWRYGFTEAFNGGPTSWPSTDESVGKKDVSEVLAIIRNALAHGNLFADGDPSTRDSQIQSLRLYSKKRENQRYENCNQSVGSVTGYKYLDIPVCGFKQFLSNWVGLLPTLNKETL